jgi:hypothetical protein
MLVARREFGRAAVAEQERRAAFSLYGPPGASADRGQRNVAGDHALLAYLLFVSGRRRAVACDEGNEAMMDDALLLFVLGVIFAVVAIFASGPRNAQTFHIVLS